MAMEMPQVLNNPHLSLIRKAQKQKCTDHTLADLEKLKAFAENLFAQTRECNQKKANATIKRHETKYKLRVYVPGEIVLVDVGKKTKVKQKRDMVKAIIVEALTNNYYTIEYAAGAKVGEQDDINGDLV